ncbi:hypothetical protein BUALT_Bualt07G0015600 [Buddleja alternifolia]|uniref:Cytochrome P450 n=1 Tax=Buddleja alternifolia TaxID=168488 RepID=A0AAV6XHV2_9LAMI|nr:hypothetical protein BUALT_Bualt07G0015600 [Buddleja alternifolia]
MSSSEISLTLFITFITLLFILMRKKTRDRDTRKLPPTPKKLPIIGNLHQLGKLPHRSLKTLSKIYGDLMFLQLGSIPTLVVSSPYMAREIFKAHDLVFSSRPPLYAVKKFSYNFSSLSVAPFGEYWREVKKIVVLELMTTKRVQIFGVQEVALMIDRFKSAVHHGKSDGEFQEILNEIQHLVGEFNIADCFPRMAWLNKFNGVERKLDKNFRDLDEFLDKVINEHVDAKRTERDHEDLIDVLLRIQKDPDQTFTLNNEQLKGVIIEVTEMALSKCWRLSHYPDDVANFS